MHHTPLITTIVASLVLAFLFGALAHKLRLPPLVGYLLAGVVCGPHVPGIMVDMQIANELSEIGVILLMFGVGLHFSLSDLLAVKKIAVPGAIVQITVATLLGMGLAWGLDWDLAAGVVFGLALSVASTVVLLRALEDRRLLDTERGRIAVGWLIVEDLAMVLALVLIPAFAQLSSAEGGSDMSVAGVIGITLGKVVAFVAFMLIVGRRVVPWMLHWVANSGSRELFSLSVLAIALGVALGAASLFGVSFALGAFFAGMILNESPLSQRAAEESLPMRDAFAVLFFVAVGMLFDPKIVLQAPLQLLATVGIIVIGKSVAAYAIVRLFGYSGSTAWTISASLAQIGEFSFILAAMGVAMGLVPQQAQDLILAGAIISIMINPLVFKLASSRINAPELPAALPSPAAPELTPTALSDHAIIAGYGRVGGHIGAALKAAGVPFLVIEDRQKPAAAALADGAEILSGNAADKKVLLAANLGGARCLFVAIPRGFEAGQVISQARAKNPGLRIVARAHSAAEAEHLHKCGATEILMGEREIAQGMVERSALIADAPPFSILETLS